MPTFDLVVVGAGGGPNEANLSGYLLKAHENAWSDGLVGIEAGSGLGALDRIIREKPDLFSYSSAGARQPTATEIYSYLRTYLITHAHLDHVLSLVLLAGSAAGPRKIIRGSRQCLDDLETIFKPGRIWPNLASWNPKDSDDLYLYYPLPEEADAYTPLHGGLSVSMFPLSHGADYASSAFFIKHDASGQEFLFFGDVEPDKVASYPRNADVWRVAAPKIAANTLDTIFIECSWPSGRPDDLLYGHLSPEHLVAELEVLAAAVVACRRNTSGSGETVLTSSRRRASPEHKRSKHSEEPSIAEELHGALEGLHIYIIHCKEVMKIIEEKRKKGDYADQPMHQVISEQVRKLAEEKSLGVTILAAEQGALIHI